MSNVRAACPITMQMKASFTHIINAFINSSEDETLLYVESFIHRHGKAAFIDLHEIFTLKTTVGRLGGKKHAAIFSLLTAAVNNKCKRLTKRLLELDVPADGFYNCPTDTSMHNMTTLFLAIDSEIVDAELVAILLTSKVNLLAQNWLGDSALMHDGLPLEIFQRMVTVATKNNQILKLIQVTNKEYLNVYTKCALRGEVDKLNILMKIENYLRVIDPVLFRNYLRHGAWGYANLTTKLNAMADSLTPSCLIPPVLFLQAQHYSYQNHESYEFLFGHPPLLTVEAIKLVCAQFHSLLATPSKCLKYLIFLQEELKRYFVATHQRPFPSLDRTTVVFMNFDGLLYPVPKPNFQGIKKHSALTEFLIAVFEKYGVARQVFKLLNFQPTEIMQKIFNKGDFFLESKIGTGLFHGKLSHMIQLLILIYAIEDDAIKMQYTINGKQVNLEFVDILRGLYNVKGKDDKPVFSTICDLYINTSVNFNVPHQVASFLMWHGPALGLNELADALVDSFCKGLIKHWKIFNAAQGPQTISLAEFVRQYQQLSLQALVSYASLLRETLKQDLQQPHLRKNNVLVAEEKGHYALIESHYHQRNTLFRPRKFHLGAGNQELDGGLSLQLSSLSISK